jgi:hypothetical protein
MRGCGHRCLRARHDVAAATMFGQPGLTIALPAKPRDGGSDLPYFAVSLKSNLIASRSSSARTESI